MTAIEFENISKQYRLGLVSTRTLSHDLNRWWTMNILRKEDPYLKVGEVNDRSHKGKSEYVWALRDINFKVEQGDVVGIIGKNGAGKSTLLKILSKVTSPTTGTIKTRGRIGSLLEVGTGFHPEMTGRENIYMNGAILGMTKQEINRKLDEIIDFSGCERYIDTPTKRYSSGMMVRLGFSVAAHLEPEILVVDEVLAVGDAEFQKKAIGKMQDVSRGEGRTVLFVSHNMGAVRNLCKSGYVLQNGMIVMRGTADDAIDYYLQDEQEDISFCKTIHDEKNIAHIPVAILSVCMEKQKYKYVPSESIPFVFHVKANKTIPDCRINCTIVAVGGTSVGTVSNINTFQIIAGEKKKIRFTLINHNLAPGKYYISFSIGIGNYTTGVKDFDYALKCFVFEIDTYSNINMESKACVQWMKSWGNIMFPNTLEVID